MAQLLRSLAHSLTLCLAATGAAQAGDPSVAPTEPTPAAAPATVRDWSGPYVGIAYGRLSGSLNYAGFPDIALIPGNSPSIFAGYLLQQGSFVYGGELAYSRGNDVSPSGFPAEHLEEMIDLKAKAGYAMGEALVYGTLGYSRVGFYWNTAGSWTTKGLSFGAGVDVAVTDRVTVGLEYLERRTGDDVTSAGLTTRDIPTDSLSLRISYQF